MAATMTAKLDIKSNAFDNGEQIPMKYTCDGEAVNPALTIGEIPPGTQTLALVVEDPDAPGGTYVHWVVWNISPVNEISENSNPGISGTNSGEKTGYHPPCPPDGSHRYIFNVYALDTRLGLTAGATKEELLDAMEPHILGQGSLVGLYERENFEG
jgi:Raf kinase inhibitor-like YbhB/YbcL family protein